MPYVSIRQRDGVTILDLRGKLTELVGLDLSRTVQQQLRDGVRNLVVHLAAVTSADSAGISELVHSHSIVHAQGGELKLACLSPKIRDLLRAAEILDAFRIFAREEDAVASFG